MNNLSRQRRKRREGGGGLRQQLESPVQGGAAVRRSRSSFPSLRSMGGKERSNTASFRRLSRPSHLAAMSRKPDRPGRRCAADRGCGRPVPSASARARLRRSSRGNPQKVPEPNRPPKTGVRRRRRERPAVPAPSRPLPSETVPPRPPRQRRRHLPGTASGRVEPPDPERLRVIRLHPLVLFLGAVFPQHAADIGRKGHDPGRPPERDPVILADSFPFSRNEG